MCRSYLVAVTNTLTSEPTELDNSRPLLPILESSSQLMEDSLLSETPRIEIDVTPIKLKKRKKRAAASKKQEKENVVLVSIIMCVHTHTHTHKCTWLNTTNGGIMYMDMYTVGKSLKLCWVMYPVLLCCMFTTN